MSEPLPVHRDRLIVTCAWCRSVLNGDRGAGLSAERALSLDVTHTICPVCLTRHFGELGDEAVHVALDAGHESGSRAPVASGPPPEIKKRRKGVRAGVHVTGMALLALVISSCDANRQAMVGRTMPHPDGCFVQVWDQPRFTGASDFINGPRRYDTLRELPGRHDWANRVRSLKPGSSASVTVWSEDKFRGSMITLDDDSRYPLGAAAVAPKIGSLSISCRALATS